MQLIVCRLYVLSGICTDILFSYDSLRINSRFCDVVDQFISNSALDQYEASCMPMMAQILNSLKNSISNL